MVGDLCTQFQKVENALTHPDELPNTVEQTNTTIQRVYEKFNQQPEAISEVFQDKKGGKITLSYLQASIQNLNKAIDKEAYRKSKWWEKVLIFFRLKKLTPPHLFSSFSTLSSKTEVVRKLNQQIQSTQAKTNALKKDLREDIQLFIQTMQKNAARLILDQEDPTILQDIVTNVQSELQQVAKEIDVLSKDQKIAPAQKPVKVVQPSIQAVQWVGHLLDLLKGGSHEEVRAILRQGKEFFNQKFAEFNHGTILQYFASKPKYSQYIQEVITPQNLLVQDHFWNNTPLIWAVANAANSNAMEIINRAGEGTYLDVQGLGGNTALHLAVGKGYKDRSADGDKLQFSNLEIARKLLEKGCNPNIQNRAGNTALHLACARHDTAMIEALLQQGARSIDKK